MQPDGERGLAQALPRAGRRPAGSRPGVRPGAGRKEIRGVLHYLVRWRGHTSVARDDEWLQADELAHYPERVAEYDAAAPRRRRARRAASALAFSAGVAAATPAGSKFRLATTAEVLTGSATHGGRLSAWGSGSLALRLGSTVDAPSHGGPGPRPAGPLVLLCLA